MSATNVEQLNQNFCLKLHQKLAVSEHENTKKISGGGGGGGGGGGMPPDPPYIVIKNVAPPTYHDPTPLTVV